MHKSVGLILIAAAALAAPLATKAAEATGNYYPASCLSHPLPEAATGPVYSQPIKLFAQNVAGGPYHDETATINVWRQPCTDALGSDGSKTPRAALLARVKRAEGATGFLYTPGIGVKTSAGVTYLRVALEPHTLFENNNGIVIAEEISLVLENVEGSATQIDLNKALTLTLDPRRANTAFTDIAVPAYAPTPADYPAAFASLPISGFVNGIFYDTTHSGEGLNVQVLKAGSDKLIDLAWFTYDADGVPFWIGGQAIVPAGANEVEVPVYHTSGGGFAGAFGADVARNAWGTVTVSFSDCNTVNFDYAADADLPAGVPSGAGSKTWTRLARVDQLRCD